MKRILVLNEKHRDTYYDVSTTELLKSAYLAIIRDSEPYGFYSAERMKPSTPSSEKKEFLALTDEQIAILPKSIANKVKNVRASYDYDLRLYQRAQLIEKEAKRLLSASREEAFEMRTQVPDGRGGTREISTLKLVIDSHDGSGYGDFTIENIEPGA